MTTEDIIYNVFKMREAYEESGYIVRDYYEKELENNLRRSKNIFITGESGCGKTWLYTHVTEKKQIKHKVINLANVKIQGGFYNYFRTQFPDIEIEEVKGKGLGINSGILAGNIISSRTIRREYDYFRMFIEENKDSLIVFDNFEIIVTDNDLLESLSCIITMADDEIMIENNIKFLLVGAVNDILNYFSAMSNYQTIANRISCVNIKGFNDAECDSFVTKRFSACGFQIEDQEKSLSKNIYKSTDGIPQSVNDLCYYLALAHYEKNEQSIKVDTDTFYVGKKKWIRNYLFVEYTLVRALYLENIENAECLNYVLYAISLLKHDSFTAEKVIFNIDNHVNYRGSSLSLAKIKRYLNQLSDDGNNNNILVKKNENWYSIKSYKTYICLNSVLVLQNGKISLECENLI